MTTQPKPPSTQTKHPWRATVRTAFAVVIALAAMLPLLISTSGADETWPPLAGALAIAGAITRLMALPQVEVFLRRFLPWLASEPGQQPAGGSGGGVIGSETTDPYGGK